MTGDGHIFISVPEGLAERSGGRLVVDVGPPDGFILAVLKAASSPGRTVVLGEGQ